MKRIGYIYEKIVDLNNCKLAIYNASKGKRHRKNVKHILENMNDYAEDLQKRLISLDFTSPYRVRVIKDGLSGKERKLNIPKFYPDQCAHHAIIQVLRPIIQGKSYYWSCGNIPKRGISLACKGVERATKHDIRNAKYCVKCDIKKFYDSIPHDKLKERLRHKIKDTKALAILDKVIDSYCVTDIDLETGEMVERKQGIPIGNYTSPWFAEFFLQPLDMFIKQELKVKHYIRYADDIVMMGSNKRHLRKCMYAVKSYVENMDIQLKENYQLFRVQEDRKYNPNSEAKRGRGRKIDFVGRCFGRGFTTIRKRRALALMRQSRKVQKLQSKRKNVSFHTAAGILSRSSCFNYTNSYGMKRKYYNVLNVEELKNIIRNESKAQCQVMCGMV